MKYVGFIGLGNMGRHMATNLLRAGRHLVVHDVDPKPMEILKGMGAKTAANPAELAEQCSEIITMLPTQKEVNEIFCSDDGILKKALPETLCIDCSTISPTFEIEISKTLKQNEIHYMDAPVSGGVVGAEKGTLTFMIGATKESFDRAKSLLFQMGKNIIHCGQVGSGQAAKLCNNMLLCIQMVGVSEAMNLGMRLGLDPSILTSVLNQSTGRCFSTEINNPVPGVISTAPASRDYKGGFKLFLATKDLNLAQSAAADTLTPIPLGSITFQLYRLLANSKKYSDLDFSAVFKFLRDESSS